MQKHYVEMSNSLKDIEGKIKNGNIFYVPGLERIVFLLTFKNITSALAGLA